MQPLRQNVAPWRWAALAAVLVAGALVLGGIRASGTAPDGPGTAVPPAASEFSAWTWLPGGRALWISRRSACIVETTTKACEGGQSTGVRLVYYGPEVRRVEVVLPLPTP